MMNKLEIFLIDIMFQCILISSSEQTECVILAFWRNIKLKQEKTKIKRNIKLKGNKKTST